MSAVPRPSALPTGATDRIHSLDILRGVALFGMIVVHFHDHSLEPGGIDDVVRTAIWRLVEEKAHGTFALLFGAGFALQLRRAEARGDSFVSIYLRRLAILALFGFAAHALFGFNVLLSYAVWGSALLIIRNWSTRALIVTAIISAASVSLYSTIAATYNLLTLGSDGALAAAQAQRALGDQVNTALRAAVAQGSYAVLLSARLAHMAWFYTRPFFFMPGATLSLFIVGLLSVRLRLFENPTPHTRAIVVMMAFGLVSWLTDNWLLPLWTRPADSPEISAQIHWLFGLLRNQWLTFTYVGGALLLLARDPRWLVRLRPIGQAGRMALTNYMVQIAVLDFLFSGYALHLDFIRPIFGPLAATLLFGAQVAFSSVWLAHYRLGPAEWVWRSLTYGRPQPMRRGRGGGAP
jgi:uncharacterized protein